MTGSVDIPPSQATNSLRASVFFKVAIRLEEEGRHNLAKLYLQRAIAAEQAGSTHWLALVELGVPIEPMAL